MVVGPDDPGDGTNSPEEDEILKLVSEQDFLQAITFHAYVPCIRHPSSKPSRSIRTFVAYATVPDTFMIAH